MRIQSGPIVVILFLTLALNGCGDKKASSETSSKEVKVPVFNADSAYRLIERQVAFGPRIPNSPSHRLTGDFIAATLKQYGAKVTEQPFEAKTFDAQKLSLRNIIGSFNPDKQKRIILAAHWDTRPFSDKDAEFPDKPFDGANDGGSGVGVLLEVARLMSQQSPEVGVDMIFFDGEDWGERDKEDGTVPRPEGLDSWWCLGSQYWAKHKHKPAYRAHYGILLDMVGGKDARFFRDASSVVYAAPIVEKVWNTAARLGYGPQFIKHTEEAIVDDHLFVNELGNIQMIDITPFEPGVGYFGSFHHTQRDNMNIISRETLNMVGRVVVQVLYEEE